MRVGLSTRPECPLFLQSLPKWWADEPDEKGQQRKCGQALFDHLVGGVEQFVGHSESERLGSLEVDDQLELGWLLDWKIEGFFTLQIRPR